MWLRPALALFLGGRSRAGAIRTASLRSPGGLLTVAIETVAGDQPQASGGQLVYSVAFRGKPLILRSTLGLDLQGQAPLGPGVRMVGATASAADETYRLVAGKASTVRNRYAALRVDLEESAGMKRRLAIEACAYDDAVAFRYIMPDQTPVREFRLVGERTEFHVAKGGAAWALYVPDFRSNYEFEFRKTAVSSIPEKQLVGLPLLVAGVHPGGFVATACACTSTNRATAGAGRRC